jgi:hypothetical protein
MAHSSMSIQFSVDNSYGFRTHYKGCLNIAVSTIGECGLKETVFKGKLEDPNKSAGPKIGEEIIALLYISVVCIFNLTHLFISKI